jgi:hypothetical protein
VITDSGFNEGSNPHWFKEKSPSFWGIFGKFLVKNRFGSDGGRTRPGLVLLLACDELFNRTIIGIVAQQIA